MEGFLTSLPTSLTGWIGALAAIIAAGFTAYLVYNRNKDGADDRLIKILQTTVEELEKKVQKQSDDLTTLSAEVQKVRDENKTLREVLQGRDAQTQEFYKKAIESMDLAKQTHATVAELAKGMKATNDNMTRLIEVISKHVDVIDHATVYQHKA